MRWIFDIDGTIDLNPSFYSILSYLLHKPGNDNWVAIVTCRNPRRKSETISQLQSWGIIYDEIYFMPDWHGRIHRELLEWKLETVKRINPDLWFDDEIKLYKQLYNMDIKEELPNCEVIAI